MAFRASDQEIREHVLTGFGDLLEWRRVELVGSRQLQNVCDTCNVIARNVKVTLCSHFFCALCYQIIVNRKMKCPIDNKDIVHEKVVDIELDEDYMDSYMARCFYYSRGCRFWGPLYRVKEHFLAGCDFIQAKCSRCNKRVDRWQAVEHRAECKFGLLQAAIEAIESLGQVTCPEDCLCHMTEREGERGEGAEKAVVQAGSGDSGHTVTELSPARYNLEKIPRRKPKIVRRRFNDASRALVWASDQSSPGDSGDELSPVFQGLPGTSPSGDGAQALPPAGKKTSPTRPTTLDVGARQAPRLTVEGIRRLSGGFVTGIACSKPWPGPTGGQSYYAEPLGTVLPSPPLERPRSKLYDSKSPLAELFKSLCAEASSVPSVAPEELMTAAVASECPDFSQVEPRSARAVAQTVNRPTDVNTEATARKEPNIEAPREDLLLAGGTTGASKGAQEHEK